MGSQTDPPYSASKAANINFAQCMAKDLAAAGIARAAQFSWDRTARELDQLVGELIGSK